MLFSLKHSSAGLGLLLGWIEKAFDRLNGGEEVIIFFKEVIILIQILPKTTGSKYRLRRGLPCCTSIF